MKKSTKKKPRHTREWFKARIGEDIIRNNEVSLLNPPIKIVNASHAGMLFITQTQNNYTYSQKLL